MDELLIEDKKYVSSKRAAKMTGYAKDYVGQLCREGRVPARLVGRSWYVLEAAIQDHRFGTTNIQPKEEVKSGPAGSPTWESPRYETSSEEILPPVQRLQDAEMLPSEEETSEENNAAEHLQDSWKAWFDRVGDAVEPVVPVVTVQEQEPEKEPEREPEQPEISEIREDEEINIPIRTIYQAPPEELLPRRFEIEPIESLISNEPEIQAQRQRGPRRSVVRTIQMAGMILAVLSVATAVVGSGYFDKYIVSVSQVRLIAGVELYNK